MLNIISKFPLIYVGMKVLKSNKRFLMIASVVYIALLLFSAYSLGYWAILVLVLSLPIFLLTITLKTLFKFKKQMQEDPLQGLMMLMPNDVSKMMQMPNQYKVVNEKQGLKDKDPEIIDVEIKEK